VFSAVVFHVPNKTYSLTIFQIKRGTAANEALRNPARTQSRQFTLPDGTNGSVHTEASAAQQPRWLKLLLGAIPDLPLITTASASAVLFMGRNERLFALTFGYGRNMLKPGAWEEDFGLKVTLNAVDRTKITTVDRTTLDAIGQHSRIQASREADIQEFGLDLEQDLLRAVTGKPLDSTLGKRLTGKDALQVTLPIEIQQVPALLDRYSEKAESEAYKEHFRWLDQIHEVKDPDKIGELNVTMIERFKSDDPGRLWLSIPDIIDWSQIDGFKYRSARIATVHADVHLRDLLPEIGNVEQISLDFLKRRFIYAVSQLDDAEVHHWPVYRCIYCEIEEGNDTYLLTNGKWYRVGTEFRQRINEQFATVPLNTITLPDFTADDKSEKAYNLRVQRENSEQYALMDEKFVQYGGNDKVEFCDLFARDKHIIHVKRYAGASAPLSHLFAQAVVSGQALRHDGNFREQVVQKLPQSFQALIAEPRPGEYEIVLAIVSASRNPLSIPFFSRVNLNHARTRLQDLGYKVSLAKIQA
jgi:uncharacterized protein (TIGR04141 family)